MQEAKPIASASMHIGSTRLVQNRAAAAGSIIRPTESSVYDAPRAARRHNARERRLFLAPAPMTVQSSGAGSTGFGLHLGGSF